MAPERSHYLRLVDRDVWHFFLGCYHYQRIRWYGHDEVVRKYTKPTTGELCNLCLAKERMANVKERA